MRKIISFMHMSLDGFVTDRNGGMEWINVDEEIFDYAGNMTNQSDTAIYGRVTYQMMEAYWPEAGNKENASRHDIEHSAWYNQVSKVVLSNTINAAGNPLVRVINADLAKRITEIKTQPGKNIVIFGSPSAVHHLTKLNLIDEYWLFINPVLLGEGIPMFKNILNKTMLKLADSHIFVSGVIGLHYLVSRPEV